MSDPNLLEFLIAKLRFRQTPTGGMPSLRQLWSEDGTSGIEEEVEELESEPHSIDIEPPKQRTPRRSWLAAAGAVHTGGPPPLAVISAVILTLAGLAMLHNEHGVAVAVVLLIGAAGAVFFAVKRGETPVYAEISDETGDHAGFRPLLAGAAAVACIITGGAALDNQAGVVLLPAWLASMALATAAVTASQGDGMGLRRWLANRMSTESRALALPSTIALPLLIVIAAVLVRTHHLATVPAEMLSVHAEFVLAIVRAGQPFPPVVFPWGPGGLEPVPVYLGAILATLGGGLSFTSLKLGTLLAGLATLPVIYLLGREVGGRPAGLAGMALAAVGLWPDLVSRIALADGWYLPLAAAAVLFLLRGVRRARRFDFVAAGLVIGLAIQTTSMARSLVAMAVVMLGAAWIPAGRERRRRLLAGLGLVLVFTLVAGLPTLVAARPSTTVVGPAWWLGAAEGARDHDTMTGLVERSGRALIMPLWSDGPSWNHGGGSRPALDPAAAVLLVLGAAWLAVTGVLHRRLVNILLLISVPLALLPAALASLDPAMAPSPLRCCGAVAPIFAIAGAGLASIVRATASSLAPPTGRLIATVVVGMFVGFSAFAGHTVVHSTFAETWDGGSWNASELAEVARGAMALGVAPERARVVPFPHWVDTRLVAVEAGLPGDDLAIDPRAVRQAARRPGPQLYLVHPGDRETLRVLGEILPDAEIVDHPSRVPGKSFLAVINVAAPGGS